MAGASGEDFPAQISALLGQGPAQIRKTDDTPPRASVIDIATIITGRGADYASQAVRNVCEKYPEVSGRIADYKFPGRRQRNTPVADVKGIVESRFSCEQRSRSVRPPALTGASVHGS